MSKSVGSAEAPTNFYTLLGLPLPRDKDDIIPPQDVKAAYRQALLLNHPDKAQKATLHENPATIISIDQVNQAYQTLLSPNTQEAYRQSLLDRAKRLRGKKDADIVLTAETFDLEDLDWDPPSATWKRGCRCGGHYSITESELERASSVGELVVDCYSCSLHIRVLFEVIADDEQQPAAKS